MNDECVELAKQLININSITPNDNGCQQVIAERLKKIGFEITELNHNGVNNLWAQYGNKGPLFVFSGHTDVVPPGPLQLWTTPPFQADIRDNVLYGRGAADMKSALAAMVVATEDFLKSNSDFQSRIGFMITSDEEGDAVDGTKKIVEFLKNKNVPVEYCLIGEATSIERLGDGIKIGRRGSLHGSLQVLGKQGHIAYPHLAENPIHRSFKALDELTKIKWDEGSDYFTPTTFQIYNINADTGANNVIPGSLTARFNFRYSPASTAKELQQKVHHVFDDNGLHYKIDWKISSKPFLSKPGKLVETVKNAIIDICKLDTNPNTTGGTSDGRFISELGCELVELGVRGHCIHQVNEHVDINELQQLKCIYEKILKNTLSE